MSSLDEWLSDQLYSLVGYSDRVTVEYLLSRARASTASTDLISVFVASLGERSDVIKVAETLFQKVKPELHSNVDASKRVPQDGSGSLDKRSSATLRHARKRLVQSETDAERDDREKREFEERLKKRDQDATKTLKFGELDSKVVELQRQVSALDEEQKKLWLERKRIESARTYKEARREKKIREKELEIADEERLFDVSELTYSEIKKRNLDKKILELAKSREITMHSLNEHLENAGYSMPVAMAVESSNSVSQEYVSEDRVWEAEQMSRSTWLNKRTNDSAGGTQMILDEIEFVSGELFDGDDDQRTAFPITHPSAQREERVATMSKFEQLQRVRKTLPMYAFRKTLIDAVRADQFLIVVGETGSGKTTQLPQYLYECGLCAPGKKIGCTQPRRVAAMSVAARVAQEMGVELGSEVGYSIRFEDCTSDKTVLKYMTDGMLLRELLSEPTLDSYSVIIVDEAHERTLHTDILFGLLKDITRHRQDLKLIVSSATLDAEKFSVYFDGASVLNIPGRRFPVSIYYTVSPEADYVQAAVFTALQIHITQPLSGIKLRDDEEIVPPGGDILIFLTGQDEVEAAAELIETKMRLLSTDNTAPLIVSRIYSALPSEQQSAIFEPTPSGARKVVVATNIAETSITIDGISYVIDCGLCKQNTYNPRTGMECLVVTPISRASAKQRAGRAGRTGPGSCFRLYTKGAYQHELCDDPIPEIQRTNLESTILLLKSMEIDDLLNFDFMDQPPSETLMRALENLYALGALNDLGQLTKLGRRMTEIPLNPMLSRMILQSESYQCSEEILTICSMLTVGSSVFYRPKERAIQADHTKLTFSHPTGDHLTLLNIYQQWTDAGFSNQWCYENFLQYKSMKRARDIRDQLIMLMSRVELDLKSNAENHEAIRKCLSAGFFSHAVFLSSKGIYLDYKTKKEVFIHPSSTLFKRDPPPKWLIYYELVLTKKEYLRQISEIDPQWLIEVAPHYFTNLSQSMQNMLENKKSIRGKGRSSTTTRHSTVSS